MEGGRSEDRVLGEGEKEGESMVRVLTLDMVMRLFWSDWRAMEVRSPYTEMNEAGGLTSVADQPERRSENGKERALLLLRR